MHSKVNAMYVNKLPVQETMANRKGSVLMLHILNVQVDAIRTGTGLVLQCRKQQRYDPVVMDASAKLLKVVPEVHGRHMSMLHMLQPLCRCKALQAWALCPDVLSQTPTHQQKHFSWLACSFTPLLTL